MLLRIRFERGPRVVQKRRKNQRVALAMAALLKPAALMTLVLAFWKIAADLRWAGDFAIPSGLFSHWQVWVAAFGLLVVLSHLLNRYGRHEDVPPRTPHAVSQAGSR